MIEIKNRKPTQKEIEKIKDFQISFWSRVEKGIQVGTFIIILLLILFLIIGSWFKIDSETELVWAIIIVIIGILITIFLERWIYQGVKFNNLSEIEIVEMICHCERAAMIEDPEDFGTGFYLEVEKNKVLFLQNQSFYEEEFQDFPNTHFEITFLKKNGIWLDFKILDKSLKPEIILEAMTMKEWRKSTLQSGDIIEKSLNQIIAERLKIQNGNK